MDKIKKLINESSKFYSESFLNFDFKLNHFNFRTFQPFLKGEFALEIGPASGFMTKDLVNCFKEIHLIEASKDLLDKIPNYPNIKKINSLIEDLESDCIYDTIIMSHVLEHISEPVPVLKKIYSWLNNNGVFLLSVPNAKSIHRLVAVEMGTLENIYKLNSRDKELGHYRVYDMEKLIADVTDAGFTILEKGGIFLKPVSNKQIEEDWTNEMIEGFYKVGSFFKDYCAEIFLVCIK